MLRKDINSFIMAIRKHENASVKQMLAAMPDLVAAKAKNPPKKDDGQSPLQIAFKVGNFEAAAYLLESGADPDYIEESEINEWKAPVLHDAIRATIFNCKTVQKNADGFEWGLRLILTMLEKGANPNKEDSYGNNCGMRAVLDARQMIMHPDVDISFDGTVSQLRLLFGVLLEFGADYDHATETRESTHTVIESMGLSEFNLLPNKAIHLTGASDL
jgi:ankyrin repeat protein